MGEWYYLAGLIASTYIAGIILGNILPWPKKLEPKELKERLTELEKDMEKFRDSNWRKEE